MVREDAIAILSILKANYQYFYKGITKQEAEDVINLWCMMFETEPLQIIKEAIKALITTHKDYPPTIAHVKEKIELITKTPPMTELEAWSIVSKALKDSYYNASLHFDNFPDTIKSVIRTPEQLRDWGQIDSATVNSVIASNFMRSYKARVTQESQLQALPESTKALIEGLKDKFLLTDSNFKEGD